MLKSTKRVLAIALIAAFIFVGCTTNPTDTQTRPADGETPGEIGLVDWCFTEPQAEEVCYEDIEFVEGDNAYTTLEKFAADEPTLTIEATDFGGELGYFVTSVNGVAGNADNFWKLFVNDAEAQTGISSITPVDGDTFSLRYEAVEN